MAFWNFQFKRDSSLQYDLLIKHIDCIRHRDYASAQLDRIETAIKGLDRMPERFPQYKKGRWRERNLRVLPVDHYCVFYVFDKTAGRVTVLRIMYSGRNMEKEL